MNGQDSIGHLENEIHFQQVSNNGVNFVSPYCACGNGVRTQPLMNRRGKD